MRGFQRFNPVVVYEKCDLSPSPVDILSFDKIYFENDITKGKVRKINGTRIIHDFATHVDLVYKYQKLEEEVNGEWRKIKTLFEK